MNLNAKHKKRKKKRKIKSILCRFTCYERKEKH